MVRDQCGSAAGEVDLLLVSPERLNNPRFRDEQLPAADAAGLLVVDEAHCISDWGHDFRPDYRRIRDLLVSMPVGRPVFATTATANQRVVDDVEEQLEAGGAEVRTYRGSLSRESLRLGVLPLPTPEARLGWLTRHLGELEGSGIVYALTVAAAEDTATMLRDSGHDVRAYTGRTDPADRLELERRCGTTRSRRSSRPAPWAWVSTSPIWVSWCTSVPRRRPSPTTSRSAGPAARPSGPTCCCCPHPRTARSGTTSPRPQCRGLPTPPPSSTH